METGTDVKLAASLLTAGNLVAIPTETVYGLAANALDENAVLKIFQVKARPFFDPLIVHVPSLESAELYASFNDDRLLRLAQKFWPGPLTLLLPKKNNVPDLVTSGLPRVAIRVPEHPVTLKLLESIDFPLAAPSANPFGYISPTEPAHVEKQLGDKINYILNGGPSKIGIESTIAGIEDGVVCIYRLGGLPVEEIEKITGQVSVRINSSSNPRAPGQLKNHYAPRKPLYVGDITKLANLHKGKKISALCFGECNCPGMKAYNLSPAGNNEEAAVNLFKYLRLADEDDSDIVLCAILPSHGLGSAINDRLNRASTRE